jgi:hypothetical protein
VSRGTTVSRTLHGAITLVFLTAIAEVWRAAVTGDATLVTAAAAGLLVAEGMLVVAAGGNCPLGPAWRRLGDETPFFELLVGPRLAPHAIPALSAAVVAALAILGARLLA